MKYLSSLKNKDLSKQICLLRSNFDITDAELRGMTKRNKRKLHPRLIDALPTIKFLINKGAKVVILSHRGRPAPLRRGISKSEFLISKQFSLKPFAKILSQLLKKPVHFIDFNFGTSDVPKLTSIFTTSDVVNIRNSRPGSIFLLENLRFLPGEEKNDKKFAGKLASLGTFYVNDAFDVSHRENASVVAITKFLPSYAGLALENELKNLNQVMNPSHKFMWGVKKPKKPLIIILGGTKISDKIGVVKNFLKRADYFLIGGGVANTFFAAQKLPIGHSLYEKAMIPLARQLLKSKKIILPIDSAVEKEKILDIGPKTARKYAEIIKNAKTIIWNGPMGYIEDKRFAKGTEAIIRAITESRAFSIIGGGETTSLMSNVKGQMSNVFLSTGGGAMLEYLAGKKLPGLEALMKR